MRSLPTLRSELIAAFALVFAGALFVVAAGVAVVFPLLRSPGEAALYVGILVLLDVAVFALFGRALLERKLLRPLEGMVAGAEAVARGELERRLPEAETAELARLAEAVNRMAERLIQNQEALAANVRSLEETNRRLTEARDELVRAEKLASVGRLAAGIAHEVGNPLGAILGYGEVARRRQGEGDPQGELLERIRAEARRIDGIVRSLLDYARPRHPNPRAVDVREVVRGARELLERQGKLEAIQVVEDLSPVPPVLLDPFQLEQVLVNLLLNAVDALEGRDEPKITLHTSLEEHWPGVSPPRRRDDPPGIDYSHRRRLHHRAAFPRTDPFRRGDRVVKIVVADNGSGIPAHLIDRVFEPFVTTKEPGRGTGLGLAVSARLVDGMGGTIQIRSAGEGGTTFRILLPVGEGLEAVPGPGPSPGAAAAGAPEPTVPGDRTGAAGP